MDIRRSEYDVSNRVDTTNPVAVEAAVRALFEDLYPAASPALLMRALHDCAALYRGEHSGYRACDTAYHDIQHVLDVTLAMSRMMDGYERARDHAKPIGPELFNFGVITALFHDIGYLRHRNDTHSRNGAEYTLTHVSRGSRFLEQYMPKLGMQELASTAAKVIHFTGYEIPVNRIDLADPMHRMLGNMLGSADIVAQMADRCYLEKCRDRLYPEFVAGGLAGQHRPASHSGIRMFASVNDLLFNTPGFYRSAMQRLTEQLGGVHRYLRAHFRGDDLYLDEVVKNIRYAERVAKDEDLSLLRRSPPPSVQTATRAPVVSAHSIAAPAASALIGNRH
ncbi:MAG: hypothetical protein ABI612_04100 [Betaproteobacteria bacterium]